jgi:hypothetical protein
MYFELQLSADTFGKIIRGHLKLLEICKAVLSFSQDDESLTDETGTPIAVDHVEIGGSTLIQREQTISYSGGTASTSETTTQSVWVFSPRNFSNASVPFLQVKQEVIIHTVKIDDLNANGANPSTTRSLALKLVIDVSLATVSPQLGGGPLSLSYKLHQVDYGPLFGLLTDEKRQKIETVLKGIPIKPVTLDIGSLSDTLGRPVNAINAGAACDSGGTFVALRVDFDVTDTGPDVDQQFFIQEPENLLAGQDWAILIDRRLLTSDVARRLSDSLSDRPEMRLTSVPAATWNAGTCGLDVTFTAELIDACPFFVDDIDMDVEATVAVRFSVPAETPDTLVTHYTIKGGPSNIVEEIGCAATAALLWPFVGAILLSKVDDTKVALGTYAAGLVLGPALTFFGLLFAMNTIGIQEDLSEYLPGTCTKKDDENYECTQDVNLLVPFIPPSPARLWVRAVRGVDRGLVMGGSDRVAARMDHPGRMPRRVLLRQPGPDRSDG